MNNRNYIPALRFKWLTNFFDPFLRITLPEKEIKTLLIKQANIKPSENILDFGCGTATLTIMVKENQPNAFVSGVDVDLKVLKIAKSKVIKNGQVIKLKSYDGSNLPYKNRLFDKVVSSLVFHHLKKDQKINALNEIYRVLKNDGELYILDFGKYTSNFMRITSFIPRILDGFENTRDNYNGLIPNFLINAGFTDVKESPGIKTVFGNLTIYSAKKSC